MTKTERRLYDYIEKKSKNNTYQIATKKELAEELDVSVSTLSKNLKRLEQDNKINVVSKRGNKGGIVISLVRDYDTDSLLHFNDTNDSVITSNLEYATELRNRFFPSYVYERKENKRRTKLEMTTSEKRLYDYIEKKDKNNTNQIATKKELAEEAYVSVSTLSNNRKRLEPDNKISVVSNGGNKGGIVISPLRDYDTDSLLHSNDTNDSVITSNEDHATELRNRWCPSYVYERKENKRVPKLDMVQYNASKDLKRKPLTGLNFYNSSLPYRTKDIYHMSLDPGGFYKAYILCELYDQGAIAHENAKYIQHLTFSGGNEDVDRHKHLSEYYRKKMLQNLSRDSICKDFFGSKLFDTFYNVYYAKCAKEDRFGFENKTQPYLLPAPNFHSPDKYLTNYENYVKGIRRGVNKPNSRVRSVGSFRISDDYLLNPAVAQLHQLYTTPLNEELNDIDTMFETALDTNNTIYGILNGMKHIILLSYNKYIEHLIEKLLSKHKNFLNKFIKQCIVTEYSPTTIPNNARLSMFLTEKEYNASTAELNGGIDISDLIDIGLECTTDLRVQDIVNKEETTMYYLHMRRFTSTSYILPNYSNYHDNHVYLTESKTIIEKYNCFEEIPLTKEGMIEYNKVIDIEPDDTKW
ncbi:Rep protein [Staphylococcus phage vB_SauH_DELF3]|nr:Rep protein [Staphylococcus phage vB_SauH_DELF3]